MARFNMQRHFLTGVTFSRTPWTGSKIGIVPGKSGHLAGLPSCQIFSTLPAYLRDLPDYYYLSVPVPCKASHQSTFQDFVGWDL